MGLPRLVHGTAAYWRANLALFLAGFSTFSLLYGVQPLLPEFTREFGVSPAASALSLSLTTAALALAIVATGAVGLAISRRGLMFASMALGAILNIAVAVAPTWPLLLATRFAEGLVLGGVPAVAMAYLAAETDSRGLGRAMGLYVAGTAFGGMTGRIGVGILADIASWRTAMGAMGILGLLAAIGFALLLPRSGHPIDTASRGRRHRQANWSDALCNAGLLRLYATGFLLMSVFVSLFNYAGYLLMGAPYGLSQSAIGLLSLTYLLGMLGSSIAGALADRFGPRVPLAIGLAVMELGIATTLSSSLMLILAGMGLATGGFFIAHSAASGWVGRLGGAAKGQAASLYLLLYYAGSSLTGSSAGWLWQHGGWSAIVGLASALTLLSLLLAVWMKEERT